MWTITDQIVSSAESLGISLVITHSVGLAGVGAFAIAFVIYQVLSSMNRALNGDPLTVGFSAVGPTEQREAFAAATGGSILLGLAVGAVGACIGAVIGGPVGHVLVALGLGMSAILVQDTWRCVFFTAGAPARALLNDLLVLAALAPACVIAVHLAPRSAASLVGAWCAATAVGALAGGLQARVVPGLAAGCRWWRATLHFGGTVLGENLVLTLAYSVGLASVALVSGVAALGRLRTAQVATNAANPLSIGIGTIIMAEGTRTLARRPDRFPRLILLGCGAGFTIATCIAVACWAAPPRIGKIFVGPSWPAARPLALGAGAYVAALAVTIVLSMGLRVMRFPGVAFKARLAVTPLALSAGILGAVFRGPGGAIVGIAASEWICVAMVVPRFRSIWKEGLWQTRPPVMRGASQAR